MKSSLPVADRHDPPDILQRNDYLSCEDSPDEKSGWPFKINDKHMKLKLAQIAHARAGDKGNMLTLSLFPFDEKHYEVLCQTVTVEALQKHFSGIIKGKIIRYELPSLSALQFTCFEALGTGVTTSLRIDAHGKSLSYALLEFEMV